MKIKELIEQLKQYDENLEVGMVYSYTEHSCCDGEYCYCEDTEVKSKIIRISEETEYNKKSRKRDLKGIWLTTG